ncbi:hypothetical protein EYZ11_008353 [Aspergillus tanneri]|uniref:Uncharacterized protein n=1 Tax=Aspergillus tanneri TaxID=1220188 RepID=A0A4V3UNR2_9EURO|nr:uncharacterized protein ATNIH1004_008510 [Aspergillus tanneri]KAA8644309.1 hypothetical protein ATNIH1004_008510 [Aspergillus tanneri]THC92194.1 hypothetical protein EYZ11_008353 [Aspergillus tanneri]
MTTIQPSHPSLTSNDSAVLQALFDAESSPSSAVTIDSSLPAFPAHLHLPEDLESLRQRELSIVRTLQPTAITLETIQTAIQDLATLIADHPTYPSAYVNRAQALRTLIDHQTGTTTNNNDFSEETSLFDPTNAPTTSAIFDDLSKAISLSTPLSPPDPVSPPQARILADAHTHRAYLLLKAARWKRTPFAPRDGGPAKLRDVPADQLEEMASRDFFFGGRYGNKVAQQMAVQTNPYAKMCGAIVKEAMRKEIEGL